MDSVASGPVAAAAVTRPASPTLADLAALAKPRITLMVMLTAWVGFLCAGGGSLSTSALLAAVAGTGLVAAGASVLNMLLERVRDALMERTRLRPLPAGRVSPRVALSFGLTVTLAGLACLLIGTNPLAASVALFTWASYVFLYTPLKPHTSLATIIGAVPGALPPVIGWTAAQGRVDTGAVLLFAILFLWQIPHFLAIAWIYREDYRRGGFPMLPVVDGDGAMTARQAFANALALVPVSVTPTLAGFAGPVYAVAAVLLGLGYAASAWRLLQARNAPMARQLFFASLVYLPLLTGFLLFDRR